MKKAVLVTGACINTGVAIAEKFAKEGYNVIFTGRSCEAVTEKEAEYKEAFPSVEIIGYPLNSLKDERTVDEDAVEEMFTDIESRGFFIEHLILNAADQGIGQKMFENPLTDFMRVINTNVVWNFALSERAAKSMREYGGGSITFVNSNTAYRVIPERVSYIASKSGQLGLMRALAFELGRYNIRVNAILPGMIKTDRWEKNPEFYNTVPSRYTPLGDVAVGSDIADAAWYFATSARNTTGAELVLDGGNNIQLYPIVKQS